MVPKSWKRYLSAIKLEEDSNRLVECPNELVELSIRQVVSLQPGRELLEVSIKLIDSPDRLVEASIRLVEGPNKLVEASITLVEGPNKLEVGLGDLCDQTVPTS